MKICVVGFGSIAKRHIINLNDLLTGEGETLTVDLLRSGHCETEIESEFLGIIQDVYHSVDDLDDFYDAIFITNPTNKHYESLQMLHGRSHCFFIEKPVFGTDDMKLPMDFISEDNVYYVACPLRYTKVISYAKDHIMDPIFVRAMASSYLPDWRPGVDYRQTYSAQKSLGGGVSIDLIHEWDYLTYLFGEPQKIHKHKGKVSNLELDVEDFASYIGSFQDCGFELHLDYFGRKPRRNFEVYTNNDIIVFDILAGTVTSLVKEETIDLCENRNDFHKRELRHFLDIIHGNTRNTNTIEDALKVMTIAEGIQ